MSMPGIYGRTEQGVSMDAIKRDAFVAAPSHDAECPLGRPFLARAGARADGECASLTMAFA